MVFGGTGVSAPLIAGIYGVNGVNGGSVNDGADPCAHLGALYGVTSGSNGSYFCTGEIGFDGPTGLGTPSGASAF